MKRSRELHTVRVLMYRQAQREARYDKDVGTMKTAMAIIQIDSETTLDPVFQHLRGQCAVRP